jgi:hypothetical protein
MRRQKNGPHGEKIPPNGPGDDGLDYSANFSLRRADNFRLSASDDLFWGLLGSVMSPRKITVAARTKSNNIFPPNTSILL